MLKANTKKQFLKRFLRASTERKIVKPERDSSAITVNPRQGKDITFKLKNEKGQRRVIGEDEKAAISKY